MKGWSGSSGRGSGGALRSLIRLLAAASLSASGLALAWAVASPPPVAAAIVPGEVVAWGDNSLGQTNVPAAAKSGVTQVSGGCGHSLALKSGGVIAWGDNGKGQATVPAAAKSGVVAISAGCDFSLALKSNGSIVAWGDNTYGQTQVPAPESGYKYFAVSASELTAVALAKSGSHVHIVHWGNGQAMEEAVDPTTIDCEASEGGWLLLRKNGTVEVTAAGALAQADASLLTGIKGMDAGRDHGVVLRSDGTVYAWGDNTYGQADAPDFPGDGVQVAANGNHGLVLTTDGIIVGWGDDSNDAPDAPGDLTFTFIAAGTHHGLAIASASMPDRPVKVTATPLDGAAAVSWIAPEFTGGAAISGYTVTSTPEAKTCTTTGALTCTVTGLTNGQAYTFTVKATNAVGSSEPSDPSEVTIPAAAPASATVAPSSAPGTEMPSPIVSVAPSAGLPPAGGSTSGSGPGPVVLILVVVLVLAAGAGIGGFALYRTGRLDLARFRSGSAATPPASAAMPAPPAGEEAKPD